MYKFFVLFIITTRINAKKNALHVNIEIRLYVCILYMYLGNWLQNDWNFSTSRKYGNWSLVYYALWCNGIIPKTEVKMTALSANMFIPIYIHFTVYVYKLWGKIRCFRIFYIIYLVSRCYHTIFLKNFIYFIQVNLQNKDLTFCILFLILLLVPRETNASLFGSHCGSKCDK